MTNENDRAVNSTAELKGCEHGHLRIRVGRDGIVERCCTSCNHWKIMAESFSKDSNRHRVNKTGYLPSCKACRNAYQKQRRANSPEIQAQNRAACRDYHARNRESGNARSSKRYWDNREMALEINRQWREAHPEWVKENRLKIRYGITLETYNEMLTEGDNACWRCSKPFSDSVRAILDHDHSCPSGECAGYKSCGLCLRGVLCLLCNSRLSVKYCRTNQHTDSYLVRYAVRRAAKEQGVDSALESLLLAIAEDPSESNAVRIRARETGAMLQRVERAVAA
jgi:hypothetical protein